jgi:hypothetical protein
MSKTEEYYSYQEADKGIMFTLNKFKEIHTTLVNWPKDRINDDDLVTAPSRGEVPLNGFEYRFMLSMLGRYKKCFPKKLENGDSSKEPVFLK